MEAKIALIEEHISRLEASVYKSKIHIPQPPIKAEDNIDPDLVKMVKDKDLELFSAVRRVPSDYYQRDLEFRMNCLEAHSVEHLCKCVLFEVKDSPNDIQKYICVVVQYVDKVGQGKLLSAASKILGSKVTLMSLAKEDEASELTGSKYNAMTPVLLRPTKAFAKYRIPIILSERIAALAPPFFWLGGGEVDVKFGIDTRKFIKIFKPYIFDISDK